MLLSNLLSMTHHATALTLESRVAFLANTLIGSVSCAEVERSRPVIGEVIYGLTGRACRHCRWVMNIWAHIRDERVSSDDLVEMR
jgi:hypothetical protein